MHLKIITHDKIVFDEMDKVRQEIEKARDEIASLKETQENSAKELLEKN